ncbi:uncharacterized protein LOC118436889 [Folsomia candida]|uniref:uncharacterized protein LOC118436889 n=1 Tax=Folsomia candida TaxID=158441 RepID=UPI001604C9B3|nr:uncharacterized protein LOC118436889 [Folsomia candida]
MEYTILATSCPPGDEWEVPVPATFCPKLSHQATNRDNKPATLLLDPDDFTNLEKFEETLKTCGNLVSVQIGGKLSEQGSSRFGWDHYAKILQLVTQYCGGRLECFCLAVNRTSEVSQVEGKLKRRMESEKREYHPHSQIWDDFVTAVAPTLRHISLPTTSFPYHIPRFAFERLILEAPNLDQIALAAEPPKWSSLYLNRAELGGYHAIRRKDPFTCLISVQIGYVDLADGWMFNELRHFVHLRNLHLYFDQLPVGEGTLDLTGFDKLVSLAITPHELGVIFDTWKTLERNETPVDLEFPEACKITKLDLRGLIMKDSFWTGLHERVPTLMKFTYCVAHAPISLIDPKSFTRLDSLQFLSLNVPINYWNDDVMTLLWHTGGPFRLHLANVQDSDVAVVDELVNLRILGSFQNLEWIAHKRDRIWIEVEFANYQQEDIHAEERATVSQQSKNFKIDWKNVHAEINAANEAEDDEYGEKKEPLPAKWVLKAVYKCD